MIIKKLTQIDNECFFRWYEFWHKGQGPDLLRCEEIAVVEENGILLAGIMVNRIPNSVFCMFTCLTRNPFCDRDLSSDGVDFLIQHLGGLAKKLGYTYFVSLVGEEPAKVRFRKAGLKELKNPLTCFYGET